MLLLLALTATIIRNDAQAQIHEAPKIIASACDSTRQTIHVLTQIKSKIETAFQQIVLGKKTAAKLSVAAAASTGEQAVAYAALAASAAGKIQAAEQKLASNLDTLLKGAAAAAELTATEELVAEAADLSLEARAGKQTSTVSGTQAGLSLLFGTFGSGKGKCEAATETGDKRQSAQQAKAGEQISFAHLKGRPKTSTDQKVAALCGDNDQAPNDCNGDTDGTLVYFEVTAGTLLQENLKTYRSNTNANGEYAVDTKEDKGLLLRETYVTARLNLIKQAEKAYDSTTFKADSLINPALVTDGTA
uniref:Variant surface glycoprotein 1759 n=1 Tax=Trypanosoma brucei TaxID=5691 RepID=M4SX68_9TRYP|nr:variant surface glycoprotein 1759 [Trypanosoma brucei]